ncbi:hypothetical protein MRX96_004213 [Rhipicephalus microplus]
MEQHHEDTKELTQYAAGFASQFLKWATFGVLLLFGPQQTGQNNYPRFHRGPYWTLLDVAHFVALLGITWKRWRRCLPPSGFVCTLLGFLATATVLDSASNGPYERQNVDLPRTQEKELSSTLAIPRLRRGIRCKNLLNAFTSRLTKGPGKPKTTKSTFVTNVFNGAVDRRVAAFPCVLWLTSSASSQEFLRSSY